MFDKKWIHLTEEERDKLPEEVRERKVFFLDSKLIKKLDFAKSQKKKNNDSVGIICGEEGSGKSSLGGNIMRYMTNDNFDPKKDMVGADYEDGIKKIEKVKQGGNLMFDEGNAFFLSTEVMKRESRDLHKIFSIFRQKQLFVAIILPSFFRLGSYFALDRSRFLLRTYLKKGRRGSFAYYGDKLKGKLYRIGKPEHNYRVVQPRFRGVFTRCYLLETKDYKNFKSKTLNEALLGARGGKDAKINYFIRKKLHKEIIKNNLDRPLIELCKILNVSESTIVKLKREVKNEN